MFLLITLFNHIAMPLRIRSLCVFVVIDSYQKQVSPLFTAMESLIALSFVKGFFNRILSTKESMALRSGEYPDASLSSVFLTVYLNAFHAACTPYSAPFRNRTTHTVLNRILISSHMFHSLIYFLSSRTTSSKSVMSLRPLTCHIPVIPGFIARRARC